MRTSFSSRALARAFLLGSLTACGGSTVTDTPDPTPPVDTTKPTPTVQRASITARVSIDPVDANLAQQAGIGVVGLTVRLTSSRGEPVRMAVVGADGTARFDNLLEASYSASVERKLTAEELAKLSPADREASVFAGGGQVVLSPPNNRSVDVAMVGARRGSIIISEVFAYYGPPERGFDNYNYGSYMEVFNNSDTTAYLDGILYVQTPGAYHTSEPPYRMCGALPTDLRLDSSAVYAAVIRAFPGSGREFPIRPGEAKVVAMDAINHAAAVPIFKQVDLSRADFEEFWTDADVDNPFATNVVRVYGGTAGILGRGYGFMLVGGTGQILLLAREARAHLTEVSVPFGIASGAMQTLARLPSEYVLDVFGFAGTGRLSAGSEYCAPWTSPKYDREAAYLRDFLVRQAITRRSLGLAPDGNQILQRTKNSGRDFILAEPLRRSLDK